jgi:hypothetical protein
MAVFGVEAIRKPERQFEGIAVHGHVSEKKVPEIDEKALPLRLRQTRKLA